MMSTATAATRPYAMAGGGPQIAHATKASTAIATTAGTKYPDTVSASRWMGARERCASATIWTICASMVSLPTRSARMEKPPVPLTVPPITLSPALFAIGMGSPVTIDSSIALRPSTTSPSTGTLSPGRTRRRSPA
jgi:hypothetical protein